DNGYDITDYLGVDSRYGLFEDFLECLHTAGEFEIRIIVDLVAQHTSDEHPWFEAARYNEKSRYRSYYIWSEHPPPIEPGKGTIFPGEEKSVWTYDERARAYYHHRFYHFQPTLNFAEKNVRDEVERVLDYWLSFGIAGFRVDAASHIMEHPLAWLGVDAIWISPVFPSPMADFGYDVADYKDVDGIFGNLEDFDTLMTAAHARKLRVLLDFVPNHTSDQHPWFIEARRSRDSPMRDLYIWRDAAPGGGPPNNWLSDFGGS